MLAGALDDLVGLRRSVAQLVDQLIEEQWHAVINLQCGWRRRRSRRHLRSAAEDDFVAVYGNEFMERDICHGLNRIPAVSRRDVQNRTGDAIRTANVCGQMSATSSSLQPSTSPNELFVPVKSLRGLQLTLCASSSDRSQGDGQVRA